MDLECRLAVAQRESEMSVEDIIVLHSSARNWITTPTISCLWLGNIVSLSHSIHQHDRTRKFLKLNVLIIQKRYFMLISACKKWGIFWILFRVCSAQNCLLHSFTNKNRNLSKKKKEIQLKWKHFLLNNFLRTKLSSSFSCIFVCQW